MTPPHGVTSCAVLPPGNGSKLNNMAGEATEAARAAAALVQQGRALTAVPGGRDAPAVLLVHGFGAFGEQWRGQIRALTRAGYEVLVRLSDWAPNNT